MLPGTLVVGERRLRVGLGMLGMEVKDNADSIILKKAVGLVKDESRTHSGCDNLSPNRRQDSTVTLPTCSWG